MVVGGIASAVASKLKMMAAVLPLEEKRVTSLSRTRGKPTDIALKKAITNHGAPPTGCTLEIGGSVLADEADGYEDRHCHADLGSRHVEHT